MTDGDSVPDRDAGTTNRYASTAHGHTGAAYADASSANGYTSTAN